MNILFIIVPIFIFCVFVFTILMIFNPKIRGKMMSRQVESLKHMTEYSKDSLKDISKNLAEVGITSKKEILEDYQDDLKDINNIETDIVKDSIREKTKAIKDGLKDTKYCKYCGKEIDRDSKFCKHCGKEQ